LASALEKGERLALGSNSYTCTPEAYSWISEVKFEAVLDMELK
jgi:hypothetical protein